MTGVGVASPAPSVAPSPSPAATASPNPWDLCAQGGLPYDRPIGLKMRVLDGPDFDLSTYRGQPLLVNVFATWCGPCNEEMPGIVAAAKTYADRNLAVVGIDDREEDYKVRVFRKEYGIAFPIAMDERGSIVRAIERTSGRGTEVPVTLFIDPNGLLYCYAVGGMRKPELTHRIEAFLGACEAAAKTQP